MPPLVRLLSAVAALALWAPLASAQTCPEALAEAEARYVEGTFGGVIARLDPCLDDTPRSIPARRLIVLTYLRLGEINEAKLALLDILAIQPTYQPDPVQDPPAYRSLVQVVREQLTTPEEAAPPTPAEPVSPEPAPVEPGPDPLTDRVVPPPSEPVAAEPAPAEPEGPIEAPAEAPPALPLALRYWVGAGSYGGERGTQASGPVQEFADNAGVIFGAGVEGRLLPWLGVYGEVEAGYYPTLPTDRGRPPEFDPIDENAFSAWVRFVTVGVRATGVRSRGIALYGALGGGLASGDQTYAGVASVGLGADISFSSVTGAVVDGTWSLTMPARAIDAAAREPNIGDLFTAVRVGLRYRINPY